MRVPLSHHVLHSDCSRPLCNLKTTVLSHHVACLSIFCFLSKLIYIQATETLFRSHLLPLIVQRDKDRRCVMCWIAMKAHPVPLMIKCKYQGHSQLDCGKINYSYASIQNEIACTEPHVHSG